MPRGRCWNWYGWGPGYGPDAGFGYPQGVWGGPGPRGLGFGFGRGGGRWYGNAGGLGWLVYDALKEGPKDQKEIADWVTSKFQTPLLADYLAPLLDWWVGAGLAKKGEDGKYSLTNATSAPWAWRPWWRAESQNRIFFFLKGSLGQPIGSLALAPGPRKGG
ncbi:MAG: hypothetical protein ACP5T2_00015 [Thermoprotei archaeon]